MDTRCFSVDRILETLKLGERLERRLGLVAENPAGSSCNVWANLEMVEWETEDFPKIEVAIQLCVIFALI